MPKRFTATEKWIKQWFQKLSVKHKLLWYFLFENCDQAGVWEPNFTYASFLIGADISERDMDVFGERIVKLESGTFWIVNFVDFQYGELSDKCRAHDPITKAIRKHGLTKEKQKAILKGKHRVCDTLFDRVQEEEEEEEEEKEKEEEEEKEEEKPKNVMTLARVALHFLNESTGKHFRETESNLGFICSRLAEPDVDLDGIKKMILRQCAKWKETAMSEYLRPQTLFNKTKFDGYYAAKDQPIYDNDKRSSDAGAKSVLDNPRNRGISGADDPKRKTAGQIYRERLEKESKERLAKEMVKHGSDNAGNSSAR